MQNFALRIVTDARKFEYITPYLKDLLWLPLAMQLEVRNVIMTYKSLNDLTLRNVLTTRSEIYERHTRNNDKLQVPPCSTQHDNRTQGPRRGGGGPLFWLIKSLFLYLSKPGLYFTKKSTLHYFMPICGP